MWAYLLLVILTGTHVQKRDLDDFAGVDLVQRAHLPPVAVRHVDKVQVRAVLGRQQPCAYVRQKEMF